MMRLAVVVLAALVLGGLIAGQARAADGVAVQGTAASVTIGGCKTVTVWRGFKLLIGIMAWKYFERISWCWNARKTLIVSFGYRRWAEVYVPTWDFKGHIGFAGSGGTGHYTARRWTQGKFQQCAAYCFQTKTPWVDLLVRANGTWAWASGG